MGGRRARTISSIVGVGAAGARTQLRRALEAQDPTGVARGAARVLAETPKPADIIYYAGKLSNLVRRAVEEGKPLSRSEREKLVHTAWAEVRRAANLADDPVMTRIVVSATLDALPKGKK